MRWLFKRYMVDAHVDGFRELSRQTGIEYRTLLNHIDAPEQFRLSEVRELDEVLRFTDGDLLKLLRGARG